MAVIGDPTARLNALATGGTAGLQTFDAAQQSTLANRQAAMDRALGSTSAGRPSTPLAAAQEIRDVVTKRTQGYTNDASSARNLAGAQVGYDASALDAFIANQQKELDAKTADANRNMELDRMQAEDRQMKSQGTLAALQRAAEEQEQANAANSGSIPFEQFFAKLSKEDQDAWVRGAAAEGARQKKQEAARQSNNEAGIGGWRDESLARRVADYANLSPAEKRITDIQMAQLEEDPNRGDARLARVASFGEPQTDYTPRMPGMDNPYASFGIPSLEQQQELADWRFDTKFTPWERQIEMSIPEYQQQVATGLAGMDPYLAAGRYPNDAEYQIDRARELEERNNLAADLTLEDWERTEDLNDMEFEQATGLRRQDLNAAKKAAGFGDNEAQDFVSSDEWVELRGLAQEIFANGDLSSGEMQDQLENELRAQIGNEDPQALAFALAYFRPMFMQLPTETYNTTAEDAAR